MSKFGDAFKAAREKFEAFPGAANYTFEYPPNSGKKFTVLKKGETRTSLFKKFESENAVEKSPRPASRPGSDKERGAVSKSPRPVARPDKPESASSGPKSRPNNSGRRPNSKPSVTSTSPVSKETSDLATSRTGMSASETAKDVKVPRDDVRTIADGRAGVGRLAGLAEDRHRLKAPRIKNRSGNRLNKGGLIGASRGPTQKGTPRFKK